MQRLLLIIALCLVSSIAASSQNNDAAKWCLERHNYDQKNFDTYDFSKAASCFSNYINEKNKQEQEELRDFLKHNPRYTVPGQSLNKCFGKPREMPFEKSTLEVGPNGMKAEVWYKDKLPANCYENAPWDNRDLKEK